MTRRAAPPQHLPENEPQKPPAQSCKDSKAERKTAYRSAGCRCQRCHGLQFYGFDCRSSNFGVPHHYRNL